MTKSLPSSVEFVFAEFGSATSKARARIEKNVVDNINTCQKYDLILRIKVYSMALIFVDTLACFSLHKKSQ